MMQESKRLVDTFSLSYLRIVAQFAIVVRKVAPAIINREEVKLPEVSDHSVLLEVRINTLLVLPVLLSRSIQFVDDSIDVDMILRCPVRGAVATADAIRKHYPEGIARLRHTLNCHLPILPFIVKMTSPLPCRQETLPLLAEEELVVDGVREGLQGHASSLPSLKLAAQSAVQRSDPVK